MWRCVHRKHSNLCDIPVSFCFLSLKGGNCAMGHDAVDKMYYTVAPRTRNRPQGHVS
jgi:hypothetical protein